MEDILLLDAVERYLKGEMKEDEKAYFEDLRRKTPEVDQMVVEHSMFLEQINAYGENKNMKHMLHNIHTKLVDEGQIRETEEVSGGKVLRLWNKYKRVTAIAASIAGVTALFISSLVSYFTPASNEGQINYLSRQMEQLKITQHVQGNQIQDIKLKVPVDEKPDRGGTSFLIDGKGYLITNAHIVQGSTTIFVQNASGQEYRAQLVYIDESKDLAILKIADSDFKPLTSLPYSIKKNSADLGEQIFTLGFPRDEVVYNEGYLSASTGYNGDTLSCQIAVSANPGNSGGPVLNKNGEVIGILSSSQRQAEGVVFAIKSKNILGALDELKKSDTAFQRVKLPSRSKIKGMERTKQIKEMKDCVFMVKGFTR